MGDTFSNYSLMVKTINKHLLILFLIIVAASFLRLWRLDKVPVSLFGDEVDVGYQAYSVLKTGKDYSGNFLPIHFHSLAEWRTPLYLYSAVPTVAIFGVSPMGVRLPAAIFGVLTIPIFYLFIRKATGNKSLALLGSLLLTVNPWHIQYSRAGFEVTLLLLLLVGGLWLFLESFKDGRWLWVSGFCFALTPWVYSTAKFFTPLLLVVLVVIYKKEVFSFPKKHIISTIIAIALIGLPIAYSTVFGGGAARFGYISIFTNPVTETEVGTARLNDAHMRGETGSGLSPKLTDRLIHNKYTFWSDNVIRNYFQAFSTEFLFIKGDINLRHSIGIGEFYKIESFALLLGIIYFLWKYDNNKNKLLILFWILGGVIPSAITRDGGNHATRLIIILPPLIFIMAYGLVGLYTDLKSINRKLFITIYAGLFILSFGQYQHEYWVHYPWMSERWWHAGFNESFAQIKQIDANFDKVVISTSGEPPWIFFAGWYRYDPVTWHANFPIGNDVELAGFGKISHTGRFYFGSPSGGLYDWGKILDKRTLYLATAKDVNVNLILEPDRTPKDLNLIKAIAYPSGEPAFYLFSGVK